MPGDLDEERNSYKAGLYKEQLTSWRDGPHYCLKFAKDEWHLARLITADVSGNRVPVLLEFELHATGNAVRTPSAKPCTHQRGSLQMSFFGIAFGAS